jgi:hypothetical protein
MPQKKDFDIFSVLPTVGTLLQSSKLTSYLEVTKLEIKEVLKLFAQIREPLRIREAPKNLRNRIRNTACYMKFYLSFTDVDCESLENFESLMCLGNLASLNESVRARILKDSNFIQVGTGTVVSRNIHLSHSRENCHDI